MTWGRGRDVIERLLAEGRLERIAGSAADGRHLITSAAALLESAYRERTVNPEASFALAYDAARKACSGLLAQQGLRTRSQGHHVTVEQAVRAQFGGAFESYGALRRRRSEIEYPQRPGDDISVSELTTAIDLVDSIVIASADLLPMLEIFLTE